jgi:hypothetical protein
MPSSFTYQVVVKPCQGPPYGAALNENTMTITIGAYKNTYNSTAQHHRRKG